MSAKTKTSNKRLILDWLVLAVAIIEPLMTIPQIYQIWTSRSAAGLSLVTWICYVFAALTWFIYGFATKDRPLIVSSAMWVISEMLVVIGILKF